MLEKLLSVLVNAEHTDWDERLPYLMMAYRSSVKKKTGNTPNLIMLGKDITILLDIQFANPFNEKEFRSGIVTKLQQRMEQTKGSARVYTDSEMHRHKR